MSVFASRYARAFADVALSSHLDVAKAREQLRDFSDTLSESRELREFLMNPSISNRQKLQLLDGMAQKMGLFPQVRNFIAVITDHQRLPQLKEILSEYDAVADQQSGLAEVEIASAHPLDPRDKAELEAQIARLARGPIRASYREDKTLLGGAVVKIGSTVYDGSVRSQLQQLKDKLVNASLDPAGA